MMAMAVRYRGRQAAESFLAGAGAGSAETLTTLAARGQPASGVWALTQRGLVSTDLLTSLAARDRDPVVALWSART
jgi:hypothetical protein